MKLNPELPLVLDIDGTLIENDLTHDLLVQGLCKRPLSLCSFLMFGLKSKATLKSELVSLVGEDVNVANLPYNDKVVKLAEEHYQRGGEVVLCSGSHQTLVDKIVGFFSWISKGYGTTEEINLIGNTKAAFLAKKYPEGFQYIGNSKQDLDVWAVASVGGAVKPTVDVSKVRTSKNESIDVIEQSNQDWFRILLKSIRVHQWVKNGLVFLVPLLTLSEMNGTDAFNVLLGFFALSFIASATYLFNDLIDAPHDREHRSKKHRPIAKGALGVPQAFVVIGVLFFLSSVTLFFLPYSFIKVVLAYLLITVMYSFRLKSVPILDVIILAILFSVRVVAGAVLVEQNLSPWLLNFVATFFLSLALVKRYTEIRKKEAKESANLLGRGYQKGDESLILSLGVMFTGLSVLSFLLYSIFAISPVIHSKEILFFILTVLVYWLMRVWFLAHRKVLSDDPVLFAIKDMFSISVGTIIVLLVAAEQLGWL